MRIECGTKAFDKDGRFIGEVDKKILNMLTGEMAYFFVKDNKSKRNVLCQPRDVIELSEGKIRLCFSKN